MTQGIVFLVWLSMNKKKKIIKFHRHILKSPFLLVQLICMYIMTLMKFFTQRRIRSEEERGRELGLHIDKIFKEGFLILSEHMIKLHNMIRN